MAAIPFPHISYTRFSLGLDPEGDVALRTLSGRVTTLNRSPGVWRGTFSLPLTGDAAVADDVEVWLSAMADGRNTSEIPLERKTLADDPNATIASGPALVAGRLRYTLSGAVSGLATGLYLRVRERLFLVESVTGVNIVLVPQVQGIAAGTAVRRAATLRVVRDPQTSFSPSPASPDFFGPWTFAFIEALL